MPAPQSHHHAFGEGSGAPASAALQGSLPLELPQSRNANENKCSNHDKLNYVPYSHRPFLMT